MEDSLSPKDFGSNILAKYVRFNPSGTILFCSACDMCMSHSSLVYIQREKFPEDYPVGAGQFKVRDGRWCFSGYGNSLSIETAFKLKVYREDDDEQALQAVFDAASVPLVYDNELQYF